MTRLRSIFCIDDEILEDASLNKPDWWFRFILCDCKAIGVMGCNVRLGSSWHRDIMVEEVTDRPLVAMVIPVS
jgi:hypothetical protein